jgi:hypothetical protein
VAAALCAFAPAALAQDAALPGPRTHVDPAEGTAAPAATADPDAPKLTYLKSDTTASDIGRGYLYVIARCDSRCILEVTATTKISGKQREVASISRTLRTNRMTRVRLKIRSDVRRRLAAGATFRFTAVPLPPLDR